jgi:anti-sigma regulatory factor (Ser/Thr protein kinase)
VIGQRTRERSPGGAVKVALVEDSFSHEALFYKGEEGFLDGTVPFVLEALGADEPVLVAVSEQRTEQLRRALGSDGTRVQFLDMRQLAGNPARVIPAWRTFLAEHGEEGERVRGIGEPAWPGRSDAELEECERHEALLNVAFAYGPQWNLLCPYDLDALDPAVIRAARLTHPSLIHEGVSRRSDAFLPLHRSANPFSGSLPDAPDQRDELAFTARGLGAVRSLVSMRAAQAALRDEAREDLVLAINELVTNSVQHGGGGGTLRLWQEPGALVCDVRDRGFIDDPLVGRVAPPLEQHGGRGLWLVNHLCDLVQIRSTPSGTLVRVWMGEPS